MKHPFRSHTIPFFTIGAGSLGFVLRLWLFSSTDEKGLLPADHWTSAAVYILTAFVLVALFLAICNLAPRRLPKKFVHLSGTCAYLLGALGLLFNTLASLSSGNARMILLATIASAVGCIDMFVMALFKYFRKRLPYGLPAILTVVLMLCAVAQCQSWGAEPQLQVYFFPLLAFVFLILTAYHKTKLAARQGNTRQLAFFSQGAVFLCCLSLNCPQWPLYLCMLFWAAVQFYPCIRIKKEA